MGYTHYWKRPVGKDIEQKTWDSFISHAKRVLDSASKDGVELAWEYDEVDKAPEATEDLLRFNGAGDEGHETFFISRTCPDQPEWRKDESEHFSFCKTAYKPYDAAVTSILVLARDILGFDISSDGGDEAFEAAPYKAAA